MFEKKSLHIELNQNPSIGSRNVSCGRTDGHHETNIRYSHFFKCSWKARNLPWMETFVVLSPLRAFSRYLWLETNIYISIFCKRKREQERKLRSPIQFLFLFLFLEVSFRGDFHRASRIYVRSCLFLHSLQKKIRLAEKWYFISGFELHLCLCKKKLIALCMLEFYDL